jgi:chorismate mutase
VPAVLQRAGESLRGLVRKAPGRGATGARASAHPANGGGGGFAPPGNDAELIDLQRRRDQLNARVAELQWDLGGVVYEMAVRDRIRVEVIVRRAAELQNADAELNEVERILRLEETATAGQCGSCGAPHSTGAAYCWQCGQPLMQEVHSDTIAAP